MTYSIFHDPLRWESTGDAVHPYRSRSGTQLLLIRLGDFPEESVYALVVDGEDVVEFDNWPATWSR